MANEKEEGLNAVKIPKDFNIVEVTLTFPDFETMKFKFRRALSKELKDRKQAFLGLTEEDKAIAQTTHRRETLAGQLLEEPINVPSYPRNNGADKASMDVVAEHFREYFSREDNEELLDYVYTAWQNKLYPKELTS